MHLLVEREDDDLGEGREGELCLACHNGLGANTNVLDGVYVPTSDPLLGGGFNNYRGLPATSRHDIHGSSPALAWGNGVNRGLLAPLTDMHLSCDSCHDPHGTGNYRNIASYINGVPVFIPRSDRDIPAERLYVAEQWGANQSTVCIACHGNYHVASPGSGSDPALLASGGFAHRNDMPYLYSFGDQTNTNPETVGWNGLTLPLAESGVTDTVVCQTCHLPHGTSAIVTDLGSAGDSALLRLDNGLVCQTCHQK